MERRAAVTEPLSYNQDSWEDAAYGNAAMLNYQPNSLVKLLLNQSSLASLLATFANTAANFIRIRRLSFHEQQIHILIDHPIHGDLPAHHYCFDLHDTQLQHLGHLHYELESPLLETQHQQLQLHQQWLSMLLPLYLKLDALNQLARLDPLTELGNRTYFEESLARSIEQHTRDPHGLVLVLLDLDNFKLINDKWGHPSGDRVLTQFGKLIKACIRSTDQAFRIGGDEFALLLQPAAAQAWHSVASRLKERVATCPQLQAYDVTVSLGAASWHAGVNLTHFYEAADSELYCSKRASKNMR